MDVQVYSWHALPISEILDFFESNREGLHQNIIQQRQKKYGKNILRVTEARSSFVRFFLQFHNVLIYILLSSALISVFLRYWVDTGVILGAVIVNACIGFIQEGKAQKAIQSIRELLSLQAVVIRDNHRQTVLAEELVPGDIVVLKSGDKVPADIRLFTAKSLRTDEAILTGESVPIEKSIQEELPSDTPLYRRTSMVYSGTMISHGTATGIVVATGKETEIGKISSMIAHIPVLSTPLTRQMNQFSRWLALAILVVSGVVFIIGVFLRHYPIEQMFMAAVSLIVAAIPEGLPAIITITLAIGVTRMAKQNAIIRHLPAVETMGSVDVICTDKTGTLTKNELMVQKIITSNDQYTIAQKEDIFKGIFISEFQHYDSIEQDKDLQSIVDAAILCNEAEVSQDQDKRNLFGDPVDKALLLLGYQAEVGVSLKKNSFPRDDLIPLESRHKFMATLHHDHLGQGYIYVKGSPEKLLSISQYQLNQGARILLQNIYWKNRIDELAAKGLRVIAIAMKKTVFTQSVLSFQDIGSDFIFLGILGLIDPPRLGVKEAVAQCRSAGITVKMITGDHLLTAKTVGEQIGLYGTQVMSGADLERTEDSVLLQQVDDVDIYARTDPEHKLRLVQLLQSRGHVVAMTGDGVNDAPALKQADIGIAMGKKGTEATKEVAEMVLADDNFVSITKAIEEGRTVYDNLKKVILFILPTDIAESMTIILAVLLGQIFPITPLQILWVNLVTAITLTLPLSFEFTESNVMKRPPKKKNVSFLSPLLVWRIFFVGFLLLLCVYGLFLLEMRMGVAIETARTVVVNMLVMGELVYLFHCRRLYENTWKWSHFLDNKVLRGAILLIILLQLCFTYVPTFQHFFKTTPIHLTQWVQIFGLGVLLYIFIGIEKWYQGK